EHPPPSAARSHQPMGYRDRKAAREIRGDRCRRAQASGHPLRDLARRVSVRTTSLDAQAGRVASHPTSAVFTASRGKPSNGCPETVSAPQALEALSFAEDLVNGDCAPSTDFHLCAITSADSRLRQPVVCSPWSLKLPSIF